MAQLHGRYDDDDDDAFDVAVVSSPFEERKCFAPIFCDSLKEEYSE